MKEYNPYEFDKIPEFAMQPAREDIDDTFDPSIYERLLAGFEKISSNSEESVSKGEAASPSSEDESAPKDESAPQEKTAPIAAPAPSEETEKPVAPAPMEESKKEPEATSEMSSASAPKDESAPEGEAVSPSPKEESAPKGEAASPSSEDESAPKDESAPQEKTTPTAAPAPSEETEKPATFAPLSETEKPVASAPMEESKEEPEATSDTEGTVISAGDDVMTDSLRLVDMTTCEPVRIFIEEDILVPDIKPDLSSVLAMDGTLRFSQGDGKISGDLIVQTLYIPQGKGSDRSVVAIESRIPFQQSNVFSASEDEKDVVDTKAFAVIESLDYSVINERKFRVKAAIAVSARRYHSRRLELFQGMRSDDVQMLRETMTVTDVILRKNERLELEEDLLLPDGLPEVESVLRCDLTLVENHKQISREKVVVSGTAYCNIMYLPREDEKDSAGGAQEGADGLEGNGKKENAAQNPVLFQGKSEFTQFIALNGAAQMEQPTGGRIFFQKKSVEAEPKQGESGLRNVLHLTVDAQTFVELYRDVEQSVVTDAYHHQKEMVFERSEISLMQLCPGGVAETTVREVVGIPDMYEGVERVAFLSGGLTKVTSRVEGNKNVVEGVVAAKLVCLSEEDYPLPFSIRRELPFRIAMDLPGGMECAEADNEAILKELRFDRLNNRQIELSASVMVNGAVVGRRQCPLIRSVGFLENSGQEKERPGLVLYITRSGDTLWNIARRYRTTIDTVAKINGVDQSFALKPGTKLLIVK